MGDSISWSKACAPWTDNGTICNLGNNEWRHAWSSFIASMSITSEFCKLLLGQTSHSHASECEIVTILRKGVGSIWKISSYKVAEKRCLSDDLAEKVFTFWKVSTGYAGSRIIDTSHFERELESDITRDLLRPNSLEKINPDSITSVPLDVIHSPLYLSWLRRKASLSVLIRKQIQACDTD